MSIYWIKFFWLEHCKTHVQLSIRYIVNNINKFFTQTLNLVSAPLMQRETIARHLSNFCTKK